MHKKINPALTANAQTLRKTMTKEERKLWYDFLRHLPVPVHRQKVMGRYIVDFYIASAKLAIELDGSQHYEPENKHADTERDAYLRGLGLRIVRYANTDIHQRFDSVCADIRNILSGLESPNVGNV